VDRCVVRLRIATRFSPVHSSHPIESTPSSGSQSTMCKATQYLPSCVLQNILNAGFVCICYRFSRNYKRCFIVWLMCSLVGIRLYGRPYHCSHRVWDCPLSSVYDQHADLRTYLYEQFSALGAVVCVSLTSGPVHARKPTLPITRTGCRHFVICNHSRSNMNDPLLVILRRAR
jgi:hypothetical protein